ncbi:MAG: hypothetical protein HQ521_15700 [Bacteroidetes bacterium]|nr:hypothetical protein [Bacteroidota bacterium]
MRILFPKVWVSKLFSGTINNRTVSWLFFIVFLVTLVIDRVITLIKFGFIYTDIDQTVMWNGAYDYSRGIFHEPFFYGQAYNYMLESLLAVPLLWMNIPVYMALPISTSFIALLPFVILSLFFMKREKYFWAYLSLAFPVLLPLQYGFLTTISRGALQAYLFIPFLFIPLFDPKNKKNITILYLVSAICFIANQSSILIIFPIWIWVFTNHVNSPSFYIKSLLVIPFLILDYYAKNFYEIHPERVLHVLSGLNPNIHTFLASLKITNHFEYLFPFNPDLGLVYPLIFLFLAIFAISKSQKKEFWFIISIIILLIITLSIPKVHQLYTNDGLFFTPSRLYLYLPIILIISAYLVFPKLPRKIVLVYFLLVICETVFITKISRIQKTIAESISESSFPVAKNQDLIARTIELRQLTKKFNLDLIVHENSASWDYVFDSYVFNPLSQNDIYEKEMISVNLNGDRRTWLYSNSKYCKQILLNGVKIDNSILNEFDHEIINQNQIIIMNNSLSVFELFEKLGLKYGNTTL